MEPVPTRLPVSRNLDLAVISSLVVAALMVVVSIAGLLFGSGHLYGDDPEIIKWFRGWDAANLMVGVPVLLGMLWLVRRGSLIGLLLWPGALFYVLYTYALYVMGAPFEALFLAHVMLVVVSLYAIIGIVASVDAALVQRQFGDSPARLAGGVLFGVGLLATAALTFPVIATLVGSQAFDPLLHAEWIVDYLIGNPVLLAGGVLLWRRMPLGYVAGPALFFLSGVNGVAFAVSGVSRALLAGTSADIAVITIHLVIAVVCFAVLGIFLHGKSGDRPKITWPTPTRRDIA